MIRYRKPTPILAIVLFQLIFLTNTATAQDPAFYGLPEGTEIRVRLDGEINSESFEKEDTFTTTVVEPVEVGGLVVLPSETVIEGRIIAKQKAGTGRKKGTLEIRFETLYLDKSTTRPIEAVLVKRTAADNSNSFDVLSMIGGSAAGGLLGSVNGAGRSTLVGAGVGAAAGLAIVLLRKGKDVRIRKGEELTVRLTKSVSLPVKGY